MSGHLVADAGEHARRDVGGVDAVAAAGHELHGVGAGPGVELEHPGAGRDGPFDGGVDLLAHPR